jgi:hypothetical protein
MIKDTCPIPTLLLLKVFTFVVLKFLEDHRTMGHLINNDRKQQTSKKTKK